METKIENTSKQTAQPWDSLVLSYGWGNKVMGDVKLQIQTAPQCPWFDR